MDATLDLGNRTIIPIGTISLSIYSGVKTIYSSDSGSK